MGCYGCARLIITVQCFAHGEAAVLSNMRAWLVTAGEHSSAFPAATMAYTVTCAMSYFP